MLEERKKKMGNLFDEKVEEAEVDRKLRQEKSHDKGTGYVYSKEDLPKYATYILDGEAQEIKMDDPDYHPLNFFVKAPRQKDANGEWLDLEWEGTFFHRDP